MFQGMRSCLWNFRNYEYVCCTKKKVNLEDIAVDTNFLLLSEFWYACMLMLL